MMDESRFVERGVRASPRWRGVPRISSVMGDRQFVGLRDFNYNYILYHQNSFVPERPKIVGVLGVQFCVGLNDLE